MVILLRVILMQQVQNCLALLKRDVAAEPCSNSVQQPQC